MMMEGQSLNDHATKKVGKLRKINADFFGGGEHLDQALSPPGKRTANRGVVSSPAQANPDRLKGIKKKPFWHVAPDGQTIERTYDGPEPLDLGDLKE